MPGNACRARASPARRACFQTRASGTPASTQRGTRMCSAASATPSRRRARWWAWLRRSCVTCRSRSPRSWRAPTSSCAERRSSSRSLAATPTTSAARSSSPASVSTRGAAAQGALVGAAKASYLPRLTIGASAGYAAPEFNAVGNQGTLRYVVGPVITWPALNLGRVKAEVDAAQAREEDARAQYSRVVLAALEDMETSLARYRSARLQVERLQEASAASKRAAALARLRFSEGITDFLQVLDAERTELEAQDRLAQGRIDAATAYAALYKAGGGR